MARLDPDDNKSLWIVSRSPTQLSRLRKVVGWPMRAIYYFPNNTSGKYDPEWKKDSEAAQAIGISGTPAFLINGRLVAGAQAFETFAQVIDEELERAGVPGPAPVAPEAK